MSASGQTLGLLEEFWGLQEELWRHSGGSLRSSGAFEGALGGPGETLGPLEELWRLLEEL